ncbi:response regulator [Desulfopila aestuarii]|nr:response regulator [Desulfopila aestuarii]
MQQDKPVVLTIDDDPAIRLGFRSYLEDCGYVVLEADNGRAGLEVWRNNPVDLILVDLHMEELDGLSVLSEVRRQDNDLPVLVVSGGGGINDVVEALRLGANDYILKPVYDMSILLHAIEKGLERARLIRENKNYQQRLEAEVSEKTEALSSLYSRLQSVVESTKKLIGCGEINESGPMILREFGYHLKAEGGSLYEVGTDQLRCIYSLDKGHAASTLVMPLPSGTVLSQALGASEPFIIENTDCQDWPNSGWSGYSSPSCIVFPLWDRKGRIFAIITLHNPVHGSFAAHDREIGAILASYVSEALQTGAAVATMKRQEERMIQSQKLEAIGTLAGGIAHDFNNILSAIVGYTDLSLFSEELSGPLKRNLEQVKKASQRARDLVHQILSFSRLEESQESVIDIVPIVKEALKLLRASIPASITIERDVVEGIGLIKADPSRIHQVLMNLCTNAAHAMQEKGGTLRVELDKVEPNDQGFSHLGGQRCIRLRVADTGTGIPAEALARIFDPYYTTKQKGEGTGLGLAMVQGIVRGAGGAVNVESEVGRGSVFDVYFPLVETPAESVQQPVDFVMPMGNECILFVDDEETLAEMAGEMLRKLGYQVKIMTSGIDALQLIEASQEHYDLVITDQTMPNISGLDLARSIVALHPGVPIILYSGYSAAISADEAREIGIKKVLMKPLSMTLLSQTVRQILDEKKRE